MGSLVTDVSKGSLLSMDNGWGYGVVGPRTHPLRPLLAEIGVFLVELLGPEERGLMNMACAAGTFGWGVQFALYDYWGREPESSQATSQQSTSTDGYSDSSSDSHRTGNSVEGTSIGTFTGMMYVDDVVGHPAPDEPSELDHQIASAAAFLTQQGLDVNWEQLSEVQQDLYHALMGTWLQGINEVD